MQQQSYRGLISAAGLVAALVFVGAGCAKTAPVTPATDTGASSAVPAPDAENVNETVVNTNTITNTSVNTNTSTNVNTTPIPAAPAKKTFSITARQWEFEPSTITVNKGDEVTLNITSEDVSHGFFLDEFGVNETLKPGVTTTVKFTADKAGTFSFACSVFCGSGHGGMSGTLVVK